MLTTTVRPLAAKVQPETSPLSKLIVSPGGSMPLDAFFDKWIPWLYRGLEKHRYASQEVTDCRTGEKLTLTWRQAWLREIESWDFSPSTAHNWGFDASKAPYFAKRIAYMMDLALEHQFETFKNEKNRERQACRN